VCTPLIGSILIKPDKSIREEREYDPSVIDESFQISVREDAGIFYYKPERLTGLMMYRVIPEDTVFSDAEDYIVKMDEVYDYEQEYLKALAIVCRSCIVSAWEAGQRPEILDYDAIQFEVGATYTQALSPDNRNSDSRMVKLNEIERAVDATKGAVITRDGMAVTAPFFTTTPSDMLVKEAGNGVGFSLNYAYELAVSGMNFYELLKYFYEDIRVSIYE